MTKAKSKGNPDAIKSTPADTQDLRDNLGKFLNTIVKDKASGADFKVGNYKCGVYLFRDYDGEPIYVGQTQEGLRIRIQRHLTNQRTDAVAMSVLDPFEVREIEVWPLPQYQTLVSTKDKVIKKEIKDALNALESKIYELAIANSVFKAILNEKNPPAATVDIELPESVKGYIVSDEVYEQRSHPDIRIARRALTMSRLGQVIAERQVQGGLRRVMLTQAKRIQWLAQRRYEGLGGEKSVETENNSGGDEGASEQ